ncbi:MAG: helix-turn-helix domain-containing protein [candidate division Zixibacteria bacterium]|nr:helix-turn-helix domain-containing protein [candidate division Zixibacteria bacterium]
MGRGRKTLFKDFIFKEGIKLAFHGFTLDQMADFWEVGISTLRRWLRKYPDFRTALKRAKDEADFKVEKGLYKRACGFKFTEKHYERILIKVKGNGNGQPDSEQHQMTLIKQIKKYYPPDTAAGFIWMKNRQPMKWRDVQERRILGLYAEVTAAELHEIKKKAEESVAKFLAGEEKKLDAS